MSLQAQSFKFDYFGDIDGIPEKFIYTIDQEEDGRLIIGSDDGVFIYDGFNFEGIYLKDSLQNPEIRCSYRAPNGEFWFGQQNGGILRYKEGELELFNTGSISLSRINSITSDSEENIWIASQSSGILKISKNGDYQHYIKGIEGIPIFSILILDNKILLGTGDGLLKGMIDENGIIKTTAFEEISYSIVKSITRSKSGYLVGTNDLGAFLLKEKGDDFTIEPLKMGEMDLSKFSINHIFDDGENNIWVSSNNKGLIQLCTNSEGVCHEMIMFATGGLRGAKSINETFIDREKNLWMASTDGLISLRNDFFSFYPINNISKTYHEVTSMEVGKNDILWVGTESNVMKCSTSPWKIETEFGPEQGLPITKYLSMEMDDSERIWIGSISEGLFYKDKDDTKFNKFKLPQEFQNQPINHIVASYDNIYISTSLGLLVANKDEITHVYQMVNGLPHNWVNSVMALDDKTWLATNVNKISYLKGDSIVLETVPMTMDYRELPIRQYTTDNTGLPWVSTYGAGITSINGENSIMLTEEDGMVSNFVSSIICDNNNRLWMTHRGGLSRYDINLNKFKSYNPVKGAKLNFLNNAVIKDETGKLWFGTSRGILRYRPELDVINSNSPKVEINGIRIIDSLYSSTEILDLPNNDYRIRFDFQAISLKQPEGVKFEYKLVGHETMWSDKSSLTYAKYNHLPSGDYTFKVRAYNFDGIGGDNEKSFSFSIDKPIWMKWWFYAIIIFITAAILRTIIKRREKLHLKNQEYLQLELDERTSEVVSQKEELEIINNDLTDSIEYAKNIQTAMLPSPVELPTIFNDAVIFFKPRDIVSGDFYWVETYGDTVMVAVGDCTGHGVPGAFMSLIGSALLKDISSRVNVNSPEVAMIHLDIELKEMLNKKDSRFGVHDGMDITIIDYNLKTKKLKICSGRRPVILYIDGEMQLMKGDRASVGGYGETSSKNFTVIEYQLKEGDRFYMYSDGIVDQFGGVRGKKLKNKAFLSYIDSIQHLPLKDQRNNMSTFFNNWKGELAQIDDVIVVGIEI